MENAIGLFSRLGCRLRGFGDDARTREVIGRACRENGWFTPADICRAVAAVADGMLRRDALAEWLAPYPVPVAEPRRVLVVMAGNIPLVGFFDMLCVLAAGHRCLVKPSAKDTVLMEYVIGLLRGIDPQVPVEFYDGSTSPDAVSATGSDNANRYFRAQYAGFPPCCAVTASRSPYSAAGKPPRSSLHWPTTSGLIPDWAAAACRCFSCPRAMTCSCGCRR